MIENQGVTRFDDHLARQLVARISGALENARDAISSICGSCCRFDCHISVFARLFRFVCDHLYEVRP